MTSPSYQQLRTQLSDREKTLAKQGNSQRRAAVVQSLEALSVGDVIRIQNGRRAGLAVVLDPGVSPIADPRPLVLTEQRWAGPVTMLDFSRTVEVLGKLRVSKHFNHRNPGARRDLASALRELRIPPEVRPGRRGGGAAGDDAELAGLRAELRAHPCHGCADREEHARFAERFTRLDKENAALRRKAEGRTHSLSRTFDRICALLTERGYLMSADQTADGMDPGPASDLASNPASEPVERISDAGRQLSRIWSESDLLIAECLRAGIWSELDAAELAGVCSAMVYEARRDEPAAPKLPTGRIRPALTETVRLWGELSEREAEYGLPTTREPDLGFVWASYRWARGDSLDRVLNGMAADGSPLPAGDFVRWMRQLLDLTEQLARVEAIDPKLRDTAAATCLALRRGVIAQQV